MTKFTIGAFAVIFNKKKEILLCHRRDCNLWNLPGGGVEKGESPWRNTILVTDTYKQYGAVVIVLQLLPPFIELGK